MNAVARAKSVVIAVVSLVLAALLVSGSAVAASAAGTGSISGKVSAEGGAPLPGAYVTLYSIKSWGWSSVDFVTTDATGAFTFTELDADDYTLRFAVEEGVNFLPEWWDDKPAEASATAITLTAGQQRTGVVATLTPGASISGTVSAALLQGGPSHLAVCAYGQTTMAMGCDYDVDTDGAYRLAGLPADTYKVAFGGQGGCGDFSVDGEEVWACNREVYWSGKAGEKTATLLPLAHQEQRTGVNQNFDVANGILIYPKITGTAALGKTLTAARGSWEDGVRVIHQWYANDVPIPGATGTTLTLTAAQVGKTISVYVFGLTSPGAGPGSGSTWESTGWNMDSKVAAGTLTSATPKIAGTVAVGSKLTAKAGTWTRGTTFRYQWLANGKPISGATKASFTLTRAQAGKSITVRVAGVKAGYTTKRVDSKATAKVIVAPTPTVSGTATVGKKLTAKPGTWTTGTRLTYQWYAGGKAISGATKATYTLKSAQRGKTVVVKVTGKKSGYATVTKASKATAKVR